MDIDEEEGTDERVSWWPLSSVCLRGLIEEGVGGGGWMRGAAEEVEVVVVGGALGDDLGMGLVRTVPKKLWRRPSRSTILAGYMVSSSFSSSSSSSMASWA